MTPDELRVICCTLEQSIATFSILGVPGIEPPLPLPSSGPFEAEIGSALLNGSITVADLPGLQGKHFAHPLHRLIFEEAPTTPIDADGCLNIEHLEVQGQKRGFTLPLGFWFETSRDVIPERGRDSCLAAAARVRELWRRRRLVARLQQIEAQLRVDAIDTDGAIAELKRITSLGPSRAKVA